jgi:iron complex transport system ATP-binding protein
MSAPVLKVRNLHYNIGDKEVLHDVSFAVERGQYWSIIGPNGAGKSTLLKCIDRIHTDWRGEIFLENRSIATMSQRELARRMSYVPQAGERHFPFTVHEFVLMGRYPHLSPFSSITAEDERIVCEALERTGALPFAHRMLQTLSGGERQNVYIAAALAQGGDVLLLDEPTTFLDYRHQAEVIALLRRINAESGTTILSVTHDINCAVLSSDHVLAIKDGATVFCGATSDVLDEAVLGSIYDARFHFLRHAGTGATIVAPQGIVI